MKLVQFKNGKWGIKMGWFEGYLSTSGSYTFIQLQNVAKHCVFDSKEKAEEVFNKLNLW